MNAKDLINEAVDFSKLPGVEDWKPNTDEKLRGLDTANCIMPSPWDISQPWTPPITSTQITIQPVPDMTVNVWKAENGFMVELGGKKYIAKTAKDIADLFIKEFDAK